MTAFNHLQSTIQRVARRRTFLQGGGALGLGMLGTTLLGPGTVLAQSGAMATAPADSTLTDADILNFALNLEYLEAEFYTFAVYGKSLSDAPFSLDVSGTGTAGSVSGGVQTTFPDAERKAIATEIAFDEQQHVKLLRAALGAKAVARPAINLAALSSFSSETQFLILARAFEDVGVSAYAGAAPLLHDPKTVGTAAEILATEAYHASNIRLQFIQLELDNNNAKPLDATDVPPADGRYFAVDSHGLVIPRTPRQVLDIVYGATGNTKGGFYPNGMNGTIV